MTSHLNALYNEGQKMLTAMKRSKSREAIERRSNVIALRPTSASSQQRASTNKSVSSDQRIFAAGNIFHTLEVFPHWP